MPPAPPHPAAPSDVPTPWLRRAVGWISRSPETDSGRPATGDPAPTTAVLDALPDAVLVVDADDRVRAANQAVGAVLGYAPSAVVGAELAETLLPPRSRDGYRARLREPDAAGPSVRLPVVRADGAEIVAEVSVRPVPGTATVAVSLRDVSASQASEAALAAAEGWQRVLRTVVDAIPDPVVAVDRAGKVVLRNRAGGDAGDRSLPAPDQRAADAVMRSGEPAVEEEPGSDGRIRLTTRVPVRDRAGAVVGLVAISRDVTAQKAAEARLRDDKRAAEAAARANSEFLATTSHEIRTLMNGVTGMTTLLLDTDLDDEQRDFVDTVRTSSDALLAVINDILDFSKIESGLLAIEDRPFSVRQTAKEALSMVAQQGSAKGLALGCDVADDVPDAVRGDAARVRQVLVNLLSNAVKFTDAGSVRVCVGAAPPIGGHPALAFAVEDTGVGVAPDRLDAVFERFAQADDSTARTHGGTGLGLSICRRLVQMMGGEMTAESTLGEGSTFRFTVAVHGPTDERPADKRPAAAPPAASEPPDAAPADLPSQASVMSTDAILPSARVLLAEDNPVNQKVAMLTLRRLGYRPDIVADGAQAVAAVRRHPYDVVLMDMMMPVMGGLEATRAIRADPGPHPAPAIVALTANAMEGDRQRCLTAGCDEYLAKPVAPKVLAATIEQSVRSRAVAPGG